MAEKETWDLSREEINKRLRKLNQEKKEKGSTRGGRSSGQGVKLLYIRDFLYANATKEHPKRKEMERGSVRQTESSAGNTRFYRCSTERR